ncbi:MAG: [FeFe] hydrogenase H-cluster maturation GTPase HydF [Bacillota bacterium]|jgi:[FeFe] hydrogenase H-cluster maturation GTPase HydF
MSLNQTPAANRLHIAIFGKRNSGKSSLINAITGQDIALVSEVAGTTTDPVYKAMEIHPLGPCMLIDTAGFDDLGHLGELRVEKTKQALDKTDIAIMLFCDTDLTMEAEWISEFKRRKIPFLAVINKADILENSEQISEKVQAAFSVQPLIISAKSGQNISKIKEEIARLIPEDFQLKSITAHLIKPGDTVLLVMPQDIQAPKGRLILPQVQTIRDLLDNKCLVMSVTTDNLVSALAALKEPPQLIITDSQVFKTVYEQKPAESLLTSFSVLFAAYKGNIQEYIKGAKALDRLQPGDKVLIAEACTHNPLDGDIGRIKIPRLLRDKISSDLEIKVVSGMDFPDDISPYALIIHCGSCMFNRRYVLTRIARASSQNIPITNYGIAIAKLSGILDKITV